MESSQNKTVKVLLADDHTLVRAGISALLGRIPGVVVVGECEDGREVLEKVKALEPDLVLMDISMPNLNGLEAAERIRDDSGNVRVIMLSMHQNEEYYWQALKAGAAGYLLKKSAPTELEAAITAVQNGDTYLSKQIADRLKSQESSRVARTKSPLETLTRRQREILQLIAEGQHTKMIASILNLSPKTVEFHRLELMYRLGIHDVAGLVRFAYQVGLVSYHT